MLIVRKEIKLDVKELAKRLEYCLRNNLEDWGEISEDDADYITNFESGNLDLLMIEIGKEIINEHTHSREV